MKKNFFLFLLFAFMISFTPKAKAVDLGPFQVGLGFCSQVNKLGSILNSYTIVQWNVNGTPGITTGMLSNTSVIVDFCNYLTQLESLDTVNAIQFSANYLNDLTGKKWDDNFQQIDRLWNISNTLYDMESGGFRKGALESASTHREINDFIKDSDQWYQKKFNGRDSDIKTRGEREAEVNNLARISYQRAMLKEITNCPEINTDNNYAELYNEKVKPKEKFRADAEEDMAFYKDKLYEMGSRFNGTESEANQYFEDLERFPVLVVGYLVQNNKGTGTTYKPKETGSGSKKKITQQKQTIETVVQAWSAKPNEEVLNRFKERYAEKWKTWVTAQWVSQGTFGLLADPASRIEKDFKDIQGECNRSRIALKFDEKKPTYEKDVEIAYNKCLNNVEVDQKATENLFAYYVTKYYNAIYQFKENNAYIWSFESQYLGRNRNITPNSGTDNFQQEEIKCEANLQPIEMEKLKLKMQSVENDLNQQIAISTMKQTTLAVQEAEAQAKLDAESKQKTNFGERKKNEFGTMTDQTGAFIVTPGSGN